MARRGRKRSPFRIKLRVETVHSLAALTLFAVGALLVISFAGQNAFFQNINNILRDYFGAASLLVPFLFFASGLVLTGVRWSFAKPQVVLGGLMLLVSVTTLGQMGSLGTDLYENVSAAIQPVGAYTLFFFMMLASFLILTDTSLAEIARFLISLVDFQPSKNEKKDASHLVHLDLKKDQDNVPEVKIKGVLPTDIAKQPASPAVSNTVGAKDGKKAQKVEDELPLLDLRSNTTQKAGADASGEFQMWQYPPLDVFNAEVVGHADRGNVKQNMHTIEETLDSFGIKANVVEVNGGPSVTQYAVKISKGTKLSKVTALASDLALQLAAPTGQIRIEAPIPGRDLVGIEIPNRSLEVVTMRRMLTSEAMKKAKSKLSISLGLNVAAEPVIADIAKMPHMLIAGATGSGKSVAVNAFIATILFQASPNEVKFILVDPKRVELTAYNDIPHLLTPVIVDPKKVLSALQWAMNEMENRYKVFAEVGVRNIEGYNNVAGFQSMPYILIVIDELADIMLFSPSDVEDAITRIAQMARATGIHLVLSTQRPSVDVITGLIKANIPARIAFNVSSMMDSRVILDSPGAEKLLGRGDMLFIPPDQAKPMRIQGTYVSDVEISNLIAAIRKNGMQPEYQEEVTTKYQAMQTSGTAKGGTSGADDELLVEAVRQMVQFNRASVSFLQRRLSLGYNRAARIVDQLTALGIIGPGEGSKPREINMQIAQTYLASQDSEA